MKKINLIAVLICLGCLFAQAEDGSRLWLRCENDANAQVRANRKSPAVEIAVKELQTQWKGAPVILTTVKTKETLELGNDGFLMNEQPDGKIEIKALTDKGLLYGSYHLLRLQETGGLAGKLSISEKPSYALRILNHWDNLDGSIERGYAGKSLWQWDELPAVLSPRYEQYARANASIGINGTVLNNVNANPFILSNEYLQKVKALAEVFRPYGLKVFLSINFASPKTLDGLPDADPLNQEVVLWWKNKVKEIYALIPDFGGFLVKANSEGQSGPQDYGRTHADGANMLADALKPYNGIVMWRAFVYAPSSDDRAKQACLEFMPFDGQFRDNVIIQIKNGPVDFQPREPFSPLFGALKHTAEMIEFQVTMEYLGQSKHLVYLAPLFKETLDSDTYCNGAGSTVAKVTDGSIRPAKTSAIAGVANTGDDANWCGHPFLQANWYAYGRLAWNYNLTAEEIADEWIRQTFTSNPDFLNPVREMMLASREACVDYMMPFGLHHLFAFHEHYGPEPWGDMPTGRRDWMPVYYHRADEQGLGFDRTMSGSQAVEQYFPPLNQIYNDRDRCPENLLLWFHHAAWDYNMKNGKTLWENLCLAYNRGVNNVRKFQKTWDRMEQYVDEQRFAEVQKKLKLQTQNAVLWRDACLLYFQTFSKMPIPYDMERPVYDLDEIKEMMRIKWADR